MSRLETPTETKKGLFIPVGGSNRDKRLRGPFVPDGDTNRDKKPPFCPGWCLQPGQKPLHGLTSIDIRLFIFTAPLSPSLISFFFPRHLLPVNFSSPPDLTPPTPSSLRCAPPRRGQGLASRRTDAGGGRPAAARAQAAAHAGRRAAAAAGRRGRRGRVQAGGRAALDGCRPAGPAAADQQQPPSSSRPAATAQTGAGWGLPSRHRSAWPSAGVRDSCRRGPARARPETNAGSVVDFLCL